MGLRSLVAAVGLGAARAQLVALPPADLDAIIRSQLRVPQACTGSADPTASTCFQGTQTILGLTETVSVKVLTFADEKGTVNFAGSGFKSITCNDLPFTKSGQNIDLDISTCGSSGGITLTAQYCSDTQTIEATVEDPTIPIPLPITLSEVACGEEPHTCTGSGDPSASTCFQGTQTILGLTETVSVKVLTFADEKGTIDFAGSGFKSITCNDLAFTKSGQNIDLDISTCGSSGGITLTAQYCSDSQTIEATVEDPTIPIPLPITLSEVACGEEPHACSGSADPVVSTCFQGTNTILGLTETVNVDVLTFADEKGTINFAASGFKSITCNDLSFTKSGQDIDLDISACGSSGGITLTAQYCSDTQQIVATVVDPAFPIPLPITLSEVSCAAQLIV